jgi:hypothetical protein
MPSRRLTLAAILLILIALPAATFRAGAPAPGKVERQPLEAQVKRVLDTLELLGSPLPKEDNEALQTAFKDKDDARAVAAIQRTLDRHCLALVRIAGPNKLQTRPGPARAALAEQGWRVFLVRVDNPSGVKQVQLRPTSPNALPMFSRSSGKPDPKVMSVGESRKRFLDLAMHNTQPLLPSLSGLEVEYRVLQVYCRDAGRKEAELGFALFPDASAKKQVAASNLMPLVVDSTPAVLVQLRVQDHDGKPVTAAFTFRDGQGRVYPSLSRRLAPDFGFHPQIYRHDNETVSLQPGTYTVTWTRGPEYLVGTRKIIVPPGPSHSERFRLQRWIFPRGRGWYSGDHHIHAAGCAHYESPTEGVAPEDMMRHVLGEDLNVGVCLSWGPCWYHQKRYFEPKKDKAAHYPVHPLSTPTHLLRYDVEVSGFPSSHCGHICLLRLKEQDYPGTRVIEEWPSWDLPIFKWARAQGGVIGFAHSGWGLDVGPTQELPNYTVPPMSGIGANEYIVDITHDLCDFISTVDTPSIWELNIWYHTLNCGYRCRISGETDFPCIYGERVGLGRSYVHLPGKLRFEDWAEGIKKGRCYVSDGKSHLMDFTVNGLGVGVNKSEVRLKGPGKVQAKVSVAALLEPAPTKETEAIRKARWDHRPYWDLERCRIGKSRKVPVELIVNGTAVARQEVEADGNERQVNFEVPIKKSSWVAVRILPSSHTNPVFVVVDGKDIRASKKSAEWCLAAVEQCWKQKSPRIRQAEQAAAEAAYDHARKAYRRIITESAAD